MHKIAIPSYATERALRRRGRLHPFDGIDPAKTALVVVDLQNGFMAPGQPAEIAEARDIVPNVNLLAGATRDEHNATLGALLVLFADVRSTGEMVTLLQKHAAPLAGAAE